VFQSSKPLTPNHKQEAKVQKIVTFLWFDSQAEEAANLYVSLFKNSKILQITRYPESATPASGQPAGSVMTVSFQLDGQQFTAINGGPHFKFTEAISLVVNCDTQEEIDRLWAKLIEGGGREDQCGWLKDKFGLSWQIVPASLGEMLKKPEDAQRVMAAVLKMKKLDIATLKKAQEDNQVASA
jgi:predicted 3-demethylubiquinone-9 3-methyltransferase (glyoxalase superfamily)